MQQPPVHRLARRSILLRASRKAGRAFTLVEILVVLAIGAMIMGLALYNVGGILGGAKEKTAKMFLTQLETPLLQYSMDVGFYPTTAEGLKALVVAPSDKAARWRGPYVQGGMDKLNDPWGQPYQYRSPGTYNKSGFDVWSKGPDGQDGTPDDICNWSKDDPNALPGQ